MDENERSLASRVSGIAALQDPVRRSLYQHVARAGGEVSRDAAARAAGISRGLAAFHLDKLVDEGLLEASYQRLSGKRGPGAGRPSKLYRLSSREIRISLPPRNYELAAHLFAETLDRQAAGETVTASDVAGMVGRRLGEEIEQTPEPIDGTLRMLERYGYEPFVDEDGVIRQRNCPFHELSATYPRLVCGLNLSLMQGMVEGCSACGLTASLEPAPGRCCVALRNSSPARSGSTV